MALSVKEGTFNAPTSTGNSAVTGVGFVPKALILWATKNTTAGYAANANLGVGFVDASASRSICMVSDDNEAATDASRSNATTAIHLVQDGTNATTKNIEAAFVSFDADGFTLNWTTTAAGRDYIIHYLALGGADITNVKVGSFTSPGGTGAQATTGIGFQPDVVLYSSTIDATGVANPPVYFQVGAGRSSSEQVSAETAWNDNSNPSLSINYQRSDKIYTIGRPDTGTILLQAALTSLDADGWTWNWENVSGTRTINYLAIKGGQYKVGVETQATSATTKATTGVGFTPKGLFLFGTNRAASSSIDTANGKFSVGATDGTSQSTAWTENVDNVSPSNANQSAVATKTLRHASSDSTTNAEAGFSAFGADGFTLDWTTADATARQFAYVAFGDTAVASTLYQPGPRFGFR